MLPESMNMIEQKLSLLLASKTVCMCIFLWLISPFVWLAKIEKNVGSIQFLLK